MTTPTGMSPNDAQDRADVIIALLASGEDPAAARGRQEEFCADVLRLIAEHSADPYYRMFAEQAVRVVDAPGERW